MRLFEIEQVFVVNDHSYRVAHSLEVVFPFGESMYYSKEFLVKDIVVPFCSGKSFGEKDIGVQISIKVCLHKDHSNGCEGGISHDSEGFGGVGEG